MNKVYRAFLLFCFFMISFNDILQCDPFHFVICRFLHHYYTHHSPFFKKYFSDFEKIYHEPSCWQLFYHHYQNDEERWAYMARSGCVMLDLPAGQTYLDLYELVRHKPYYIITTNQDA